MSRKSRTRRVLRWLAAAVTGAAVALGAVLVVQSRSDGSSDPGSSNTTPTTAASPETGWLAAVPYCVLFLKWTQADKSITGTAQAADPRHHRSWSLPMRGSVNGSDVTIDVAKPGLCGSHGTRMTGTMTGDSLLVSFAQPRSTPVPVKFQKATAADFNEAERGDPCAGRSHRLVAGAEVARVGRDLRFASWDRPGRSRNCNAAGEALGPAAHEPRRETSHRLGRRGVLLFVRGRTLAAGHHAVAVRRVLESRCHELHGPRRISEYALVLLLRLDLHESLHHLRTRRALHEHPVGEGLYAAGLDHARAAASARQVRPASVRRSLGVGAPFRSSTSPTSTRSPATRSHPRSCAPRAPTQSPSRCSTRRRTSPKASSGPPTR